MVDTYCQRAFAYCEIENIEAAFADIQTAISLDDTTAQPFIVRSILYMSSGKQEEALADLNEAEKREPNNHFIGILKTEVQNQPSN